MALIKFHKVNALPGVIPNSAVLFIPGSAGVVEMFVTSSTGTSRQVSPVSGTAPPAIATTGNAGNSDIRARADHTHALTEIPTACTATTQTVGNNTTRVATTAFVMNNVATTVAPLVSGATGTVGSSTLFARADHQHIMPTTFALPNGVTGATQTLGDNTTKVATTAFVAAAVAGVEMAWTTEEW